MLILSSWWFENINFILQKTKYITNRFYLTAKIIWTQSVKQMIALTANTESINSRQGQTLNKNTPEKTYGHSLISIDMMTSSNGKFSALLAICAGKSPVPGEVPRQRPVTRSFDVFFDLRLNKRFSKQWWGWWFETLSRPLWRHRNRISTIY